MARVYLADAGGLAREYQSVEIEASGWVACRPSLDGAGTDRYPPGRVLRVAGDEREVTA